MSKQIPPPDYVSISVNLKPDIAEYLQQAAKQEQTTVDQVIEHLLNQHSFKSVTEIGSHEKQPDGVGSDWKIIETELHKQKQLYDDLVAAIPVMIYRAHYTAEGKCVLDYVNPRSYDLHHIEPQALVADSSLMFKRIHPEDAKHFIELRKQAVHNLDRLVWEGRFIVNGETRWRYVDEQPRRLPDDTIVIDGAMMDITEHKRAEESLRIYQLAIEAANDQITVVDSNYRFMLVNSQYAHLHQLNREDVIGKHVEEVVGSEIFKTVIQPAMKNCLQGEVQRFENEYEYATLGKRTLSLTYSPLRSELGEISAVAIIIRDITERRQMEIQAHQLELEHEKVQILREFLEDISHDFRTPITIINTSTYLLKKQLSESEHLPRILYVENAAKNLNTMLEKIIQMVRLDHEAEFEPVISDLNKLLVDQVFNFEPLAQEKEQSLKLEPLAENPFIYVDQNHFIQALDNVLENAIDNTPLNGTVTVRSYSDDINIVIEIQDTGIGIADEDLPHIFERFYRVDKARSTMDGHNGLGLAITKKIIDLHQGKITVESTPDVGTTFRIFLPSRA